MKVSVVQNDNYCSVSDDENGRNVSISDGGDELELSMFIGRNTMITRTLSADAVKALYLWISEWLRKRGQVTDADRIAELERELAKKQELLVLASSAVDNAAIAAEVAAKDAGHLRVERNALAAKLAQVDLYGQAQWCNAIESDHGLGEFESPQTFEEWQGANNV